MEHPTNLQFNQNRSLTLPSRCWSLYQDSYDQNGEDFILACQSSSLHQKRQGRQRIRIWKSFPTWTHKRQFSICFRLTSVEMPDKSSFVPLLEEYTNLYGKKRLASVATDKGYWSLKNQQELSKIGVSLDGLQQPSTIKPVGDSNLLEHLRNRRAGIEPLIGHAKHGGQLGRSRMKSDMATLAAGYGSILGINLRQLIRHQQGKMKNVV